MLNPHPLLPRHIRSLGCVAAAALSATVPSQAPPARPILVEARDENRKPLVGAEVRFYATARPTLRALAHGPAQQPRPQVVQSRTGRRGRTMLRPPPVGDGPAFGALMVTYPSGGAPVLGALQVGHVRGLQIRCTPMAELTMGAPADVHVQAIDSQGRGHDLRSYTATRSVRLPAGHYRILLVRNDTIQEHSIYLRSGRPQTIPQAAEATPRRLEHNRRGTFVLPHRPYLALPQKEGGLFLPVGDAPLRLLELRPEANAPPPAPGTFLPGQLVFVTQHFIASSAAALPAAIEQPDTSSVLVKNDRGEPVPALVIAMRAEIVDQGIAYHTRSMGRTDAAGRARFAAPAPGEEESLLIFAPGYRALARSLPITPDARSIRLERSRRIPMQIFGPRGEPAAHLRVDLQPGSKPGVLDSTLWTNALGQLRLDLPAGEAQLRLRAENVLDQPIPITVPARPKTIRIRAEPGFTLRGIVLGVDGRPASRAVVKLRDSTGQVDIRRTTITDARGRFSVGGLPEHARLRVSASRSVHGRGEISAQIWAKPQVETEWTLQLRSEDPVFPGRRK